MKFNIWQTQDKGITHIKHTWNLTFTHTWHSTHMSNTIDNRLPINVKVVNTTIDRKSLDTNTTNFEESKNTYQWEIERHEPVDWKH